LKLSVIIPVYNEVRTVEVLLEKVRQSPVDKEIIVVDGASEDGTRDVLKRLESLPGVSVVFQSRRRGRGNALKVGLQRARGDLVIFQDADLELDPNDYPALLQPILDGEADVVFGSRFLRGRPRMTFLQYWGNQAVNFAVDLLYRRELGEQALTDVETCYQVFRRRCLAGMRIRNNDFAFTVELTAKLIRRGFKIREIPISYFPRGRSEGKKVRWKDGIASLWTLVLVRLGIY